MGRKWMDEVGGAGRAGKDSVRRYTKVCVVNIIHFVGQSSNVDGGDCFKGPVCKECRISE